MRMTDDRDVGRAADGWDRTAGVFRALANPARMNLLRLLARGPRGGQALAVAAGISPAAAAGHLRVLARHKLVARQGRGRGAAFALAPAVGTPAGTVFAFAGETTAIQVVPDFGAGAAVEVAVGVAGPCGRVRDERPALVRAVPANPVPAIATPTTEELIRRARQVRQASAEIVSRARAVQAAACRARARAIELQFGALRAV